MNRCSANLSVLKAEMHQFLNSENVAGFLSDTLQCTFSFLHGIYTRPAEKQKALLVKENREKARRQRSVE